MLNKNIVLHKIPGYRVPILAIWGVLKLNINVSINPFSAKDVLIDFTLSNARRFYSSQGAPLALKGLKNYLP